MRGGGFHDRSRNPNSYPMTSAVDRHPSAVTVRVNGALAGRWELPDDPADSRGVLSWHYQLRDGELREAGSYGELLRIPIPAAARYRAEGDPSPPAPIRSTLAFRSFSWPSTPTSGSRVWRE